MVIQSEDEYIIHPSRRNHEKIIPENGLFLVNPTEAEPRIKALNDSGGNSRFLFNSNLSLSENSDYFLAGPSIGAPMAAITAEKLIALGAKKLILCGWCGALDSKIQVGDVLVPDAGLAGEGTSQYYSDSPAVYPSMTLSDSLAAVLIEQELPVKRGRVWSTDAIYREHRGELSKLRKSERIAGVDMEFTALCSIAKLRGIQFAAVLIVSDELWGNSWRPGFSNKKFKKIKTTTLDFVERVISTL